MQRQTGINRKVVYNLDVLTAGMPSSDNNVYIATVHNCVGCSTLLPRYCHASGMNCLWSKLATDRVYVMCSIGTCLSTSSVWLVFIRNLSGYRDWSGQTRGSNEVEMLVW